MTVALLHQQPKLAHIACSRRMPVESGMNPPTRPPWDMQVGYCPELALQGGTPAYVLPLLTFNHLMQASRILD